MACLARRSFLPGQRPGLDVRGPGHEGQMNAAQSRIGEPVRDVVSVRSRTTRHALSGVQGTAEFRCNELAQVRSGCGRRRKAGDLPSTEALSRPKPPCPFHGFGGYVAGAELKHGLGG